MKVILAGVGMGDTAILTQEAHRAMSSATVIIGAPRLLESLCSKYPGEKIAATIPEKVATIIGEHPEWQEACVILSGDIGFYSGANKLIDLLASHELHLICGISTPQYFAARLHRSWQSFHLVSAHGVTCNIVAEVLNHSEAFFLAGGTINATTIIEQLCIAGLGEAQVSIGENLSHVNERITTATAAELRQHEFSSLAVVLVENKHTFTRSSLCGGIRDDAFIRGDTPMTKREVRASVLALLSPQPDAILYDIGAGTGSVAVEMALAARYGTIFAIEHNRQAHALILRNRQQFGTYNLQAILGRAPSALTTLPPCNAAFIGGSGGKLPDIIQALTTRNPSVRLVISAVTLETLSQAVATLENSGVSDVDVVQIAVTRTRKRGDYHMFDALNPVFLISGGGE